MSGSNDTLFVDKQKEEQLYLEPKLKEAPQMTLQERLQLANETKQNTLTALENQFAVLSQIRQTGRPENLEPAEKESPRYRHVGHFDKKARKSAAKEAASLTKKAKNLHAERRNMARTSFSVAYDLKMMDYMKQAELETLKANGYAADSKESFETKLKYLRHSENLLELAFAEKQMSPEQEQSVAKSLQKTRAQIEALQNTRHVWEPGGDADKGDDAPLPPAEAKKLLKVTMQRMKRSDLDLLGTNIFSPKLAKVADAEVAEAIRQEQERQAQEAQKEKEKEAEAKKPPMTEEEKYNILRNPSPNEFEDEVNDDTELIDQLLIDIKAYKEQMGGAPHYEGQEPSLDFVETETKIFGYPRKTFIEICKNHINNGNIFEKGFFKMVAKANHIRPEDLGATPYETAYLELLSLKKLAQKKETITRMFNAQSMGVNKQNKAAHVACGKFFYDTCQLTCHADENSAVGVLGGVVEMFNMVREHAVKSKEEVSQQPFFEAFQGVCFESRLDYMKKYDESRATINHDRDVPDDGQLHVVDSRFMPLLSQEHTYLEAAGLIIGGIGKCQKDDQFFPETKEVMACLKHELVGKTFRKVDAADGNPEPLFRGPIAEENYVVVTEEMLEEQSFIESMVDECFTWDENYDPW